MAISFVNQAAAASTTVAMPAQQIGDLIMVFAFNKSSTTIPTVPAGYFSYTQAGTTCAAVFGYKFATTAAEATGTWTGATGIEVMVYRGVQRLLGGTFSTGSSLSMGYVALTLAYTNSTSWGVRCGGHSAATNLTTNSPTTTPNTRRTALTSGVVGFDSNAALAANITAGTQSVNTTGNWITWTVELVSGDTGTPTRDIYIADFYTANTSPPKVVKLSSTGVQTTVGFSGLGSNLYNTVVDTMGNIYAGDSTDKAIYKLTPNGTQSTLTLSTIPGAIYGMTRDITGNIYFCDQSGLKVYKLTPAGVQTTITVTGLGTPLGIAIDTSNNLFIADVTNKAVYKITNGGTGTQTTLTFSSTALQSAYGLATDLAGNLYVADNTAAKVFKLTPGGTQTTVGFTSITPIGVAVDGAGTIYTTGSSSVVMLKNGVQTTLALSGIDPTPRLLCLQPYSTNDFFNILNRKARKSLF